MIGSDIVLGRTVSGGAPLLVDAVKLEADSLASFDIPSGQWYS